MSKQHKTKKYNIRIGSLLRYERDNPSLVRVTKIKLQNEQFVDSFDVEVSEAEYIYGDRLGLDYIACIRIGYLKHGCIIPIEETQPEIYVYDIDLKHFDRDVFIKNAEIRIQELQRDILFVQQNTLYITRNEIIDEILKDV